jgi:glycosyltransferase involved in cell wall biosynthesis
MLGPFSQDGHKIHVVLPHRGPLIELLMQEGIVVHVFPSLAVIDREHFGSTSGKLMFCLQYFYSIVWLSILIVRLKIDVVHTNTAVMPAPALAAWLTRRKHVWHIREFFSEFQGIWKFYQRYMWQFSSRVIAISIAVRDQFAPRYQDKIVIVYDGLPKDAMAVNLETVRKFRSSLGDPGFLIGVVGRIKWIRKGQEVLIKAAALLANQFPDARYVVVGSAARGNEEHLENLHELIRQNDLDGKVTFTGDVSETREMYGAFDVTVVPSVFPEPFGCVVMESMAAGTPVVGSNCGGIPEQIVDGSTGMLFKPGDEHELAKALAFLMSNQDKLSLMSTEGKDHFRKHFSVEDAHPHFVRALTHF